MPWTLQLKRLPVMLGEVPAVLNGQTPYVELPVPVWSDGGTGDPNDPSGDGGEPETPPGG